MGLQEEVNDFVKNLLESYEPAKVSKPKGIHDAIWGTNIYYAHEIAVLDSPLLQRLRHIRQMGFCYLTYPSATHTRLEHTLGVMTLAKRYLRTLSQGINLDRRISQSPNIDQDPETGDLSELRMAALLHDVGHGFFSHGSEVLYEDYSEIEELQKKQAYTDCQAHEILSYLIVSCAAFRDWFDEYIINPYPVDIDLDQVGNMIIGCPPDESKKAFLSEIINGPLDADKMDYISRDAYYSGLDLSIDIDHLLYNIDLFERESTGGFHLVLKDYIPAEQLFFSKAMLYSTVYHHQNARSCEAMLKGICKYARETSHNIRPGNTLASPVDFLKITDNEFLSYSQTVDDRLRNMIKGLAHRDLYKRACVINQTTVDNWSQCHQYLLTSNIDSQGSLSELRSQIYDNLSTPSQREHPEYDIWVDLPQLPPLDENEGAETFVKLGGEIVNIDELFPVTGWKNAYLDRKWNGHVFCPNDIDLREEVYTATREVLGQKGIELNERAKGYTKP